MPSLLLSVLLIISVLPTERFISLHPLIHNVSSQRVTIMPEHTKAETSEANFYPVDGIRGHCECGNYLHYISQEGETECNECGRVWNVYVDHELWKKS